MLEDRELLEGRNVWKEGNCKKKGNYWEELLEAVLRIRDVYPGSRIPNPGSWIPEPGSRIPDPKTAIKERVKKISCHTFFCNHIFHKFENYFIFDMVKKKI